MFNKLFNSKLNEIADWIIRLIVLNVMMIFFSLAIVTIYPAISAGYNMFSDYTSQKNPPLFKGYFKYFKTELLRKIFIEIIIAFVFFLAYLNIRYYDVSLEQTQSGFYLIGYYISLALIAIWTATSFYTIVVVKVRPSVRFGNLFKLAFYLAGKFYLTTLLLVTIVLIPFLLIVLASTISPLVFIFMGLSIPVLLGALVTKKAVRYLEGLNNTHG
ncbi:MAG: DUF624 domain-containing protein [Candidatus Izemoplasmatales bacterium]